MDKKCDMFGCINKAKQEYTLGPGTTLTLCKECAVREGLEKEDDS